MRRITVIVVLSVLFVVLSGCDKVKSELQRRHLGAQVQEQTTNAEKTSEVKRNNDESPSERKQIVIRIELPTDEKLQIRLVKLPISEEKLPSGVDYPPDETLKEEAPKAETLHNDPEKTVETDKKTPNESTAPKDEEPKSEIRTVIEPESHSEMKTYHEERSPETMSVPEIVVPEVAKTSPPGLFNKSEKKAETIRSEESELAPAEKAVGSALSATPPTTIPPSSHESVNGPPGPEKTPPSNPWAIPNVEYPLRYY